MAQPPLSNQPTAVRLSLTVNGERHRISVDPRLTLLDLLRDRLALTGAKRACDRGECGACTVLIGGRPVYSCIALACSHHGARVTTIEDLGRGARLHPVQRAFVDADAVQCGFCTPGQVLSAVALLEQHPRPSAAQIAEAMSGNLCRCGTYPKILRAIRATGRRTKRR